MIDSEKVALIDRKSRPRIELLIIEPDGPAPFDLNCGANKKEGRPRESLERHSCVMNVRLKAAAPAMQ